MQDIAKSLQLEGIAATCYHGQMDANLGNRNQESGMNEEPPGLVGTIAFGLAINTADVRAVAHLREVARSPE
ncbi:MAG TPA: hypothetical protein VM120_24600 [Bryobacteraceae bacterium]|nr:hypothetical protein [Bryobacteraceae bacterium]